MRNRRKRLLTRNRRRYFSLNLDPPSKPRTGLYLQLNSEQMEEKQTTLINKIKKSTSVSTGFTNLKRCLSFCDCLNEAGSVDRFNLRTSFSQNNLHSTVLKSVPINSPNNIAASATSRFSTSETETIIMANQFYSSQNKNNSLSTKTEFHQTQKWIENRFIKRFNTFKIHHSQYNHSNHNNRHKNNYKKLLRRKQNGVFEQDASCSEVELDQEETLHEENQNFKINQTKECSCANSMFNSYRSLEDKSKRKEKMPKKSSEKPSSSFKKLLNNKNNFDEIHDQHALERRMGSSVLDFISELPLERDLTDSLSKQDNPFHLFLCFSLFVEHRDHVMQSDMDANDIACYFDKMTRLHNMKSVLNRARYLYTELYLKRANAISYIQSFNQIQNTP